MTLDPNTPYRVPRIRGHERLAGRKVYFTGATRTLPAGGGTMALFRFVGAPDPSYGDAVWLRPWLPTPIHRRSA